MMTLNEFIELFCAELNERDFTPIDTSTDFHNLETWDSITALLVMVMIEEQFDIRITGDDMRNCNTIEDLYNLIKSKSQ